MKGDANLAPSFFHRLFHLHSGEVKGALLFCLAGFLWAFATICGERLSVIFILYHLTSAALPVAYIFSAFATVALSSYFILKLSKLGNYRYFQGQVLAGLLFYAFSAAFIHFFGEKAMPYIFWIAFNVFAYALFTLMNSTFWNYLDYHYNMQDAKRLFSLFNSATFLGMTTAGAVLAKGVLSSTSFILLIMATLLLSGLLIAYAYRTIPLLEQDENVQDEPVPTLSASFAAIMSSPFAFLLIFSNFLSETLTYTCEFRFQTDFETYFGLGGLETEATSMTNAYSIFIGKLTAIVAFSNLVFSVFGFNRAISRFGVQNSIIIIPLLFLAVFSGWLVLPGNLAVPILGFVIVEGAMYSIDYNNFNVVINGVPHRHKGVIRYIIESFFEPLSLLLSGLFLHFFASHASGFSLILSLMLFGSVLYIRQTYPYALLKNLIDSSFSHFKDISALWNGMQKGEREENNASLVKKLKSPEKQTSYDAAKILLNLGERGAGQVLTHMIDTRDPNYLDLFSDSNHYNSPSLIRFLLGAIAYKNDRFFPRAVFYLALNARLPLGVLPTENLSTNPYLVGAQVIVNWEKEPKQSERLLQSLLDSEALLDREIAVSLLSLPPFSAYKETLFLHIAHDEPSVGRKAAASLSCHTGLEDQDLLFKLASLAQTSRDVETVSLLTQAVGSIVKAESLSELIPRMMHLPPFQISLFVDTVSKNLGESATPMLFPLLEDSAEEPKVRLIATQILAKSSSRSLEKKVLKVVAEEKRKAWFYLVHAYGCKNGLLLEETLLTGYQTTLNFIIHLLGAAKLVESGEILAYTLVNGSPKIQAQALETLEKFCPKEIFEVVYPLYAPLEEEEKLKTYQSEIPSLLTLEELLDNLKESPSKLDRYTAGKMIHE